MSHFSDHTEKFGELLHYYFGLIVNAGIGYLKGSLKVTEFDWNRRERST